MQTAGEKPALSHVAEPKLIPKSLLPVKNPQPIFSVYKASILPRGVSPFSVSMLLGLIAVGVLATGFKPARPNMSSLLIRWNVNHWQPKTLTRVARSGKAAARSSVPSASKHVPGTDTVFVFSIECDLCCMSWHVCRLLCSTHSPNAARFRLLICRVWIVHKLWQCKSGWMSHDLRPAPDRLVVLGTGEVHGRLEDCFGPSSRLLSRC